MDDVVAPLLQCKLPFAVVYAIPLPQPSIPVTLGVAVVLGAAVPVPAKLVQPFTVVVTALDPAFVTVIQAVVAPLLHTKLPAVVVHSVELPQLLTTVTTGVAGTGFGAAVPLPAALVQPLTVIVTIEVPVDVTVMQAVVAPVLHTKLPAAVVHSVELPQLLTTVTTGVSGIR